MALSESGDEKMVSLNFTSWNHVEGWLRGIDALRRAVIWRTLADVRLALPRRFSARHELELPALAGHERQLGRAVR
jgi:hypothetical protein